MIYITSVENVYHLTCVMNCYNLSSSECFSPCLYCKCLFQFVLWGDFSLRVIMGSDSIPPNSFGWEYRPRSSLCTHAFHHTDSKDPDIHVLDVWMPVKKITPNIHHLWRQNMTTWMVELKNGHIRKKFTQNGEPQRYSCGTQKKFQFVFDWFYLT